MSADDRRTSRGVSLRPSDLIKDRGRALALTPVSRETLDRLDRFVGLLLEWQQRINLIAPSTEAESVDAACRRLVAAHSAGAGRAYLGRSRQRGGFPGLVVACALAETPGAHVHLVESTGKKAAFLREAIKRVGAPATVHAIRVEDFTKGTTGADRGRDRASLGAAVEAADADKSAVEKRQLCPVSQGPRC